MTSKIAGLPNVLFPNANRTHETLVKARNGVAHHWGRTWGGCVMGHIGRVVGLMGGKVPSIVTRPEGIACAQAMGFDSPNDAMRWNDRIALNQEMVLERLDAAIKATAPAPIDPLVGVEIEPEVKVEPERELITA